MRAVISDVKTTEASSASVDETRSAAEAATKKLSGWREHYWPHALALLLTLFYWIACLSSGRPIYIPERVSELIGAGVNVGGVVVAFMASTQGVLMTIQENQFVARLKKLGVYPVLLGYFSSAIFWCFLWVLLSIAWYFTAFDPKHIEGWQRGLFLAWCAIGALTAGTCFRITRLFSRILHS